MKNTYESPKAEALLLVSEDVLYDSNELGWLSRARRPYAYECEEEEEEC